MTNADEDFLDKCDTIANHGAQIGEPLHQAALDLVKLLRVVRETADSALPYAVASARADGASWERIARTLGVSKQAAQQRFGTRASDSQLSADMDPDELADWDAHERVEEVLDRCAT